MIVFDEDRDINVSAGDYDVGLGAVLLHIASLQWKILN